MINNRTAFTMIELVFVIVVLGILASVAIPRLAANRGDAQVATGRATVAAIRSAIMTERQARLFQGQNNFIATLDNSAANAVDVPLFGGLAGQVLLQNPITSRAGNGGWMKTGALTYTYTVSASNSAPAGTAVFTYTPLAAEPGVRPLSGDFDCAGGAGTVCAALTD